MTYNQFSLLPSNTMPATGQYPLTAGASKTLGAATLTNNTVVYRGFRVLAGDSGKAVVVQMVDGSIGYWDSVTAGQDYEACFIAFLSSGTFKGSTVTSTVATLIALT